MNTRSLAQAPAGASPDAPVPWWRVGVMWFFFGGLGAVVIGSFALLATALRHADTVVPQEPTRVSVPNAPTSPALQARNHAATPRP
jgi:hypothetical protein